MHGLSRARFLVLGLVALCALLALPGGALADKPTFRDQIDDTFEGVDLCGVVGTLHVTGTQVGTETDTSFAVTGQVTAVFTAEDGRTVTLHNAGLVTSTFTDNGDGTGTVVDTFTGLPEKISGSAKGGTVSRDAGIISFVTTFDLVTGDVISSDVIVNGPHPEADSDFTLFCDAVLAALG